MSNEEKSLVDFESKALRGPKSGAYQQLLSQTLIKAKLAKEPIQKIATICEAAMMSRNKDELDMGLIDSVYAVCTSFNKTELNNNQGHAEIAWTFPSSEENYKRLIEPWQKIGLSWCPLSTDFCHDHYPSKPSFDMYTFQADQERNYDAWQEIQKKVVEEINKQPTHKQFYQHTSAVSRGSYFSLVGEFQIWALRKLLEVQTILMDEVDPKVYQDTLSIFTVREEKPVNES